MMMETIMRLPATEKMRAYGRANQFKKPNLTEAHTWCFGTGFGKAHSALADARAAAAVYFHVSKGGTRWMKRSWFERTILKKGPYDPSEKRP